MRHARTAHEKGNCIACASAGGAKAKFLKMKKLFLTGRFAHGTVRLKRGQFESGRDINPAGHVLIERKTSVKNEPYFVLKAANHEIIGRSEMDSSASAMENGIASVKANAPGATVTDLTA